jgi:tRNA threonylcarbamoyl adenosine modification protein YeaZ
LLTARKASHHFWKPINRFFSAIIAAMPNLPIALLGISCDAKGVEISAALFESKFSRQPEVFVCARQEGPGSSSDAALSLVDEVLGNFERSIGTQLRERGASPRDWLDGLVFNAGPGGFISVRGACALAQGLGFGWSKSVAAISSLDAWAESLAFEQAQTSLAGEVDEILVLLDARMGELYAGHFRLSFLGSGRFDLHLLAEAVLAPERISTWIQANRLIEVAAAAFPMKIATREGATPATSNGQTWYCGDFQASFPALVGVLQTQGARHPSFLEPEAPKLASQSLLRRAFALGRAAFQAPCEVGPRYIRNKVALNSREQQALRDEHRAAAIASNDR